MSLKVLWLDNRELKGLRIDINFIASEELIKQLDEAIETNEGAYLCNIFSSRENCKVLIFKRIE